MITRRILPLGCVMLLLFSTPIQVQSQRMMHFGGLGGLGGLKGHRGHGAVELLLATGILAKLLNHRAKHGASLAGRQFLHALLGGHRYPAHHMRYPLDIPTSHHALLQDDLLEQHASMASLSLPFNENDLMLNQESALLAAQSPMIMSQSMLSNTNLLAAEAQLSQQLMAARRARKLLEAKKLLAAQEATQLLAAQSEVANMMAAAQEPFHTHAMLTDQSRQVFTSLAPPKNMHNRPQNPLPMHHQKKFQGGQGPVMNQFMGSQEGPNSFQGMMQPPQMSGPRPEPQATQHRPNFLHPSEARQMQVAAARSDDELTIPADFDEEDAAQIIASLAI